jgi:hypothetical protein
MRISGISRIRITRGSASSWGDPGISKHFVLRDLPCLGEMVVSSIRSKHTTSFLAVWNADVHGAVSPHDHEHSTRTQWVSAMQVMAVLAFVSGALHTARRKRSPQRSLQRCVRRCGEEGSESGEHRILPDVGAENAPPLPNLVYHEIINVWVWFMISSSSLTSDVLEANQCHSHGCDDGVRATRANGQGTGCRQNFEWWNGDCPLDSTAPSTAGSIKERE